MTPDYRTLARREVSRILQIAVRAIERELNAPPPRQAVTYSNGVTVNTKERYLRMKGK
jgi:hypothetical protein